MSVRTYRAAATAVPPRIEIDNPAGIVRVDAVQGAGELEVEVEALNAVAEQLLEEVEIEATQGGPDGAGDPVRLRVRVPAPRLFRTGAFAVRVTTPPDAAARLTVASADVEVRCAGGRFRESMLFTHRGLSGPAILQISSYWQQVHADR